VPSAHQVRWTYTYQPVRRRDGHHPVNRSRSSPAAPRRDCPGVPRPTPPVLTGRRRPWC